MEHLCLQHNRLVVSTKNDIILFNLYIVLLHVANGQPTIAAHEMKERKK